MYIKGIEYRFPGFINEASEKIKNLRNIQFYNDLIKRAHDALNKNDGFRFAEKIRKKYTAALIDEFQDTDRRQYEIFKIIFDNTQDGLLLVDTSNRKICMCNKAICKMLGYTKKELLSSKIDRLHLNKNMFLIIDDFSHKEDGQKETNFNIAIRRKDGKVFYADINDTCLKINDTKYIMANFRKTTKN